MVLSAAASLDGRIASRSGDSALSSEADLARVHRLRARHDAVLVGRNTVRADDPLLTVRLARGRDPARVVLDSAGTIPLSSRIMRTCGRARTIVAVSRRAGARRAARLRGAGAEVVVAGGGRVDIGRLLGRLAGMGIRSVLVEGGGRTNWEFVRRGLFDEVVVAVSPALLGGRGSVPLVDGPGFGRVADSPALRLVSCRRLGDHAVLRYARD